jgi:hypothetical protein
MGIEENKALPDGSMTKASGLVHCRFAGGKIRGAGRDEPTQT